MTSGGAHANCGLPMGKRTGDGETGETGER